MRKEKLPTQPLFLKIEVLLILLVGIHSGIEAQPASVLRVVFYNVENFFDPGIDSVNIDQEFTPAGEKHWTWSRYKVKLDHLYKTLIAVGGWNSPGLIGLCEVENQKVLDDLVEKTPLSKLEYKVVHYDSPDHRGIDCALLYLNNRFHPIHSFPVPVKFSGNPDFSTRDILYVQGILPETGDTLHVFVNHWPSRRNGRMESESKRILAGKILKAEIDSITEKDPDAKILIMGDFNDESTNQSLSRILKAEVLHPPYKDLHLYNLSTTANIETGSIKFQGAWFLFDQIIVSGDLLKQDASIKVSLTSFALYNKNFLLKADDKYLGKKPFPTYEGYRYAGGFSDHLPISTDLIISSK